MKQTARTKADCAIYCTGDTLNGTEHATRSAAVQLHRPAFRMHANDAVAADCTENCAPRAARITSPARRERGEGRKKTWREIEKKEIRGAANRRARRRASPSRREFQFAFGLLSFGTRGLLGSTDFPPSTVPPSLSPSLSLSLSLA